MVQTLAMVRDLIEQENRAISRDAIPKQLAETQKRLNKLSEQQNSFFGIEVTAREKIIDTLNTLRNDEGRLSMLAEGKYPLVNSDPLKWRDKKGFPIFALFSLRNPYISFYSDSARNTLLPNFYKDMHDTLKKRENMIRRRRISLWGLGIFIPTCVTLILFAGIPLWMTIAISICMGAIVAGIVSDSIQVQIQISSKYEGVIPETTRQKILDAQADFGNDIYILAEIPGWKENQTIRTNIDPLVLGYKHGNLWLIDSYDTTPLEDYVRQEFTTNA